MKRKHHDLEFKKDVVRLSYESGKSVRELAKDMGISDWAIYRWRKDLSESGEFKVDKEVISHGEEIKRLKRELADVKLERDILKKAMVIFTTK